MLKRFYVFVSVCLVISLNSAFANGMNVKIKNIGLAGLFENSNSDEYVNAEYLLPLDERVHKVGFTCLTSAISIPFIATYIKTTLDKERKYYTDEIKIEYFSMALSDCYQNDAILKFKGYDENGNILPVNKVVSFRKADNISSGWMLKKTIFPIDEVIFTTKDYGENKGVTDRAWFIIRFSYPASER